MGATDNGSLVGYNSYTYAYNIVIFLVGIIEPFYKQLSTST